MGGVGKTELALQYALQSSRAKKYTGGICWLDVRGLNVGIQIVDFARTYLKLQLPEGLELPSQVRHCWHNWLQGDVLVVLDDVTDYQEVEPYLPPQKSRFKVLMTTRLQLGAPEGEPIKRIDLQVLTSDAALAMLRSYIGDERVDSELEVAKKLCKWLGYLPLGLELVGRYLAIEEDLSLVEIQQLLVQASLKCEALDETYPEMTAGRNVAAAFDLSWKELDENAQILGYLLSLFASASIPWSLVERVLTSPPAPLLQGEGSKTVTSTTVTPPTVTPTTPTPTTVTPPTPTPPFPRREGGLGGLGQNLQKARRALLKFNLIKRTKKDTYQLHELIREFFQDKRQESAEADELQQAFAQVMVEIAQTIPDALTLEHIAEVQDAIPHLAEVAKTLMSVSKPEELVWLKLDDIGWPFTGLGRFYKSQGRFEEAEPFYLQALELRQRLLGENHPDVATSLNNLALLYDSQGRYKEAEPLCLQALELRQRLLGENHPDVAQSLNDLAGLYDSQGRYKEAEPFYLQALELYKRLLGEEQPHVATSLNNLALLYKSQGRYEKAEPLYLQALELRQRLQGENHPNVATSLSNLASLYYSQGRYSEAEPLHLQALELEKRLLGENHPHVATSLNDLALLYKSQGRYEKAEPLYLQALELSERVLGENHPNTVTIRKNLQILRDQMGRNLSI